MNRIGAFFAILLVVLVEAGGPATAAPMIIDPNPTAFFMASLTAPHGVSPERTFHFQLTHQADATVYLWDTEFPNASSSPPFDYGYKFLLGDVVAPDIDTAPALTSLNDFLKDTDYTLVLFLDNTSSASTWTLEYKIAFSAVTTPIPATLPLFAAALTGLGLCGWRKRRNSTA